MARVYGLVTPAGRFVPFPPTLFTGALTAVLWLLARIVTVMTTVQFDRLQGRRT